MKECIFVIFYRYVKEMWSFFVANLTLQAQQPEATARCRLQSFAIWIKNMVILLSK